MAYQVDGYPSKRAAVVGLHANGMDPEAIASRLGMSTQHVRTELNKVRRKVPAATKGWTTDKLLKASRLMGAVVGEVSVALNVSADELVAFYFRGVVPPITGTADPEFLYVPRQAALPAPTTVEPPADSATAPVETEPSPEPPAPEAETDDIDEDEPAHEPPPAPPVVVVEVAPEYPPKIAAAEQLTPAAAAAAARRYQLEAAPGVWLHQSCETTTHQSAYRWRGTKKQLEAVHARWPWTRKLKVVPVIPA